MSGASRAADTLRDAIEDPLRAVAATVAHTRDTQAELRDAEDLTRVMICVANMALACEALMNAAEAARKLAREALAATMADTGATTLTTSHHTVSLREATRFALIQDPALVPAEYLVQREPEIDRVAIRKALLDGTPVPGTSLSNGGAPSITFRARSKA